MFLLVEFPSNKAGLATVGYAQHTSAGAVAVARTTTGVVDMGNGAYGVVVTPNASAVMVKWDTGEATPLYAHDTIVTQTEATIAAAVWSKAVEGTYTAEEVIKLMSSVLLGKVSGAGSGTEIFRDMADTKARMTFTTDATGNRTSVVRDAT